MRPHLFSLFIAFMFLAYGISAVAQKRKRGDSPSLASVKSREAEFYFTEAEKYYILEDYSKALDYYQKVLEITPESATVHYKIADVLSRTICSGHHSVLNRPLSWIGRINIFTCLEQIST